MYLYAYLSILSYSFLFAFNTLLVPFQFQTDVKSLAV